ncbi:hypothetical protein [Aeromonas veronii]|uniref:hypothetical protein n=1 Tax=Aeromonas veronii TaxID=654 RepID=UPI003B9ED29D
MSKVIINPEILKCTIVPEGDNADKAILYSICYVFTLDGDKILSRKIEDPSFILRRFREAEAISDAKEIVVQDFMSVIKWYVAESIGEIPVKVKMSETKLTTAYAADDYENYL